MRLETERMTLRPFEAGDEPFILELLNDPGWIRFIGDRNIRTLQDAGGYISRIVKAQERFGFSLLRVALKDDTPIGMCGLIKRDNFEDVDIGFAFMPAWRGQGYARESAEAVRDYAVEVLGLERVVAFTDVENHAWAPTDLHNPPDRVASSARSEERRVGKECRSRWSTYH